ncbi:unnamed protein product [Arctia plantaginis]|uniref:Uncharacterized protein n=1 Tax=Arctia plantaginis TaxID=874455 RepID=A0A8S1ATP1_ARCPL|nr:unnamed protein product [Arctia plantaginis]
MELCERLNAFTQIARIASNKILLADEDTEDDPEQTGSSTAVDPSLLPADEVEVEVLTSPIAGPSGATQRVDVEDDTSPGEAV